MKLITRTLYMLRRKSDGFYKSKRKHWQRGDWTSDPLKAKLYNSPGHPRLTINGPTGNWHLKQPERAKVRAAYFDEHYEIVPITMELTL